MRNAYQGHRHGSQLQAAAVARVTDRVCGFAGSWSPIANPAEMADHKTGRPRRTSVSTM